MLPQGNPTDMFLDCVYFYLFSTGTEFLVLDF